MNNTEKEGFSYTYNAKEQEEIKNIREKYVAPEESKLEQLRRLDRSATGKATNVALTLGILGALIMGTGMSLAMTQLRTYLGMGKTVAMLLGIGIGLVGMVLVSLAYPVYQRTLERARKKLAPQILQLTDELLK